MELLVLIILASIANIFSFLWTILFGSTPLSQVLRDRRNRKPVGNKPGTSGRIDFFVRIANLFFTVCLLALVLFLVFQPKESGATFKPTSTPTHTATITPTQCSTPCPLYHVDWSKGLNGWKVGSQLSVSSDEILISNANSNDILRNLNSIIAPFQPQTANYAVEAQIQFHGRVSSSIPFAVFGIIVRGGADLETVGYFCYIFNNNSARIKIAPDTNAENKTPYLLDTSWHSYRVEAKNSLITFFMDNIQLVQVTGNTFMLPGVVGLLDINSQISVRSFMVYPI